MHFSQDWEIFAYIYHCTLFWVAELHSGPYSLERLVFQIFIAQLVDNRPDVGFYDNQLGTGFVKAAACEIETACPYPIGRS